MALGGLSLLGFRPATAVYDSTFDFETFLALGIFGLVFEKP